MNPKHGISHETLPSPSTISRTNLSVRKIHNFYFCTPKLWIGFFQTKNFCNCLKKFTGLQALKEIKTKRKYANKKKKNKENLNLVALFNMSARVISSPVWWFCTMWSLSCKGPITTTLEVYSQQQYPPWRYWVAHFSWTKRMSCVMHAAQMRQPPPLLDRKSVV